MTLDDILICCRFHQTLQRNVIIIRLEGCIVKLRGPKSYRDGHIQLYFYEINILYFTKFSVRSSISELEAVHIFKLRRKSASRRTCGDNS